MSKYFMQDTRYASFERMMMDIPTKRDTQSIREKTSDKEIKNPIFIQAGEKK